MIANQKILLTLLPFWTPQVPPFGICSLKTYLQDYGYDVKTMDANNDPDFRKIYYRYFETLQQMIPHDKQGNFYTVGHHVLRNHLLAYPNKDDNSLYEELLEQLMVNFFYAEPAIAGIHELDQIVADFYRLLDTYIEARLQEENPDVLGLSVFDDTMPASIFAFKRAKEIKPGIKTVMGGGVFSDQLAPGSENFNRFVEESAGYLDAMIVGEGEHLLLAWLKGELPSNKRVYSLDDVNHTLLDISNRPITDFSDIAIDDYPYLIHYSSRSCPFQCSFCSETVAWGKYRKKSADRIVEEFTQLHRTYKRQLYLMSDSLLNPLVDDLSQRMMESDLAIYWDGYLRVEPKASDTERTLQWRRGGFYRASLGIESGSEKILKAMDKRISPDQIRATVSALAHAGIKTTTLWMVGYPGETEEDFQHTLNLIEDLKDDIYEIFCTPFNVYQSGQVNSTEWGSGIQELFGPEFRHMLPLRTYTRPNGEPSRQEAFQRLNRFVAHFTRLGIPAPVTMEELHKADERWLALHPNAVPPLVAFRDGNDYIDECKHLKQQLIPEHQIQQFGDFNF
jgi:radical SAM superfamily enzyme YgiQ (UPF0313 family)